MNMSKTLKLEKISSRSLRIDVFKSCEVLQISDVHYDSVTCDRELLTKHLKEAERRNALVFINGDWFDLMQGKWDPRGGYSGLRQEYKHSDYLDRVIQDSAEYLGKFNLQYVFALGNHETNIIKRMHTNPISALCLLLRSKGKECVEMGYDGYVLYKFTDSISKDALSHMNYLQYFHHGSGGNAPRSKGILSADIDQKDSPDADMITKGHDHNKWSYPSVVERVDKHGAIKNKTVWHLRTGSYQALPEYGWAKEKKFGHPSLGGWFVTMTMGRKRVDGKHIRMIEVKIESAE